MLPKVTSQTESTADQCCSASTAWRSDLHTISICFSLPVVRHCYPGRLLDIKWQAKVIFKEVLEESSSTKWSCIYFNKTAQTRTGSQLHEKHAVYWKLKRNSYKWKRGEILAKITCGTMIKKPKRIFQHWLKSCQRSQHDCAWKMPSVFHGSAWQATRIRL